MKASPRTSADTGRRPISKPLLRGSGPEVEFELVERDYLVRVARDAADVESAQRLRYEVFNVELGNGATGPDGELLDEDAFDAHCDHLLLIERESGAVVGTYRIQTQAMAERGAGFYCAGEFELDALGPERLAASVELGRACISRDHRMGQALYLLWRGVARYATLSGKHLFFGCCSLSTVDPRQGLIAHRWLERRGRMHPEVHLEPTTGHECVGAPATDAEVDAFEPPPLFGTYLRYGALACGSPALDRGFGTVDFLVLVDSTTLDPRFRRLFFED